MKPEVQDLIVELDATLGEASSSRQSSMLRSVVALFLNGAETYSEDQVALFDNVIGRLIANADRPTLVELSTTLAPVGNAPPKVMGRLASHEDIAIAGPVLDQFNALTEQTLVEVAKTKGPKHLAAIAGRPQIGESVTEVLIERGSAEIALKLTCSQGCCFSELGFVKLINRARSDKALAAAAANRSDVPLELQPFLKQALA